MWKISWCYLEKLSFLVRIGGENKQRFKTFDLVLYIAVQVEEAEAMKKYGVSKVCLARSLRTFRDSAN
jgi:hypothetical protein